MVDLSGDGVPDVLPNTVNVVVWYEVVKKADGKGFELKKHDFGKEAAGHGVGSGDVNGDGRTDLLTPKGWFEAPADPAHDSWAWHPEWQARRDRHPDAGARRRRRRAFRRGLRHGPRLRTVLVSPRQECQRRAHLDQGDDRRLDRLGPRSHVGRHRRRRQSPRAGYRQASLRPRDRAGRHRRLDRSPGTTSTRNPRAGPGT